MSHPPAGPPTPHGYRHDEAWDGYGADDDRTAEKNAAPSVEDDPDLTRIAPREPVGPGSSGADSTRGRSARPAPRSGIVNGSAPINGATHAGETNASSAGAGLGGAMGRVAPARPHPVGDEDVTVRRSSSEPLRGGTPPASVPPYLDETAPAPDGLDRAAVPEVASAWFRPDAPNPGFGHGPPGQPAPVQPGTGPAVAPQAPRPSVPAQRPGQVEAGSQHSPWAEHPGPPEAAPAQPAHGSPSPSHRGDTEDATEGEAKATLLDRVATVVDWMRGREKASEARRKAKEAGQSPRQRTWSLVRELTIVVIVGVAVTLLLRAFVLQPFGIPSESMQDTLMVDDKVVVSKLSDYHRGDILVFRDDHGWLDPAERSGLEQTMINLHLMPDEQYLTKRLIGLPGDRVQFDPTVGKLTVNGYQLEESDYLFADSSGQPVASVKFEVVVPQGHVFMMGDNRSNSRDSRCYLTQADQSGEPGSMAFISTDAIVGPAAAVYLPLNRIQTFDIPRTFAGVPDPTQVAPKDPVVVGSEMC